MVLQLSVSLLPARSTASRTPDVAVVIDVLRATSVMAVALQAGVKEIITCRDVQQATDLAGTLTPRPLLCGERQCRAISGFDLGNSPAEYTPTVVAGRSMVMTTTNGTAAINATGTVPRVITASFLNFSAAAQWLRGADHVQLVCAGTNGQITGEDTLLAGGLADFCVQRFSALLANDEAILARQFWRSWFSIEPLPTVAALADRLRETQGGRNLQQVGYQDDLLRCAAIDSVPLVPQRVQDSPAVFRSSVSKPKEPKPKGTHHFRDVGG